MSKTDPASTLCAKKTTIDASDLMPFSNAPLMPRVASPDELKRRTSVFNKYLKKPTAGKP